MPQLSRMRLAMFATLVGLALGGLVLAGGAFAQTAPATNGGPPPAAQESEHPPAENVPTDRGSRQDSMERVPVFAITSVELLRSTHSAGLDVVAVRGVTSSDGWRSGTLVPLSQGIPADGVLDLVLVAAPPEDSVAPSGFAPIVAVLPLSLDHPYKAIRVRSATNAVLLKQFPGYAEAASPSSPCGPCVGKYFVAKGAAPAGVPADEIVRQEDLPPKARVIGPGDGIDDMRSNPNRLTIIVSEDGRIVDATWE